MQLQDAAMNSSNPGSLRDLTAASLPTLFLSPQDVACIVSLRGLPATLRGMASFIEHDFKRWPAFDKSARLACHSPDGVIELMPIADDQTFTFKYVNGHPKNTACGLSTVMAFGVLADVATGQPQLISELTLTTALRTAATSALAAQALARPGSRSMALIGNGAQSEFQALAFHHLLGISALRLFDTDPAATAKLMRNLKANPDAAGLQLTACASAAEAVQGVDIITTVTADKANATILTADMLRPGQHLNAVGGDCPGKTELHADVLRAAQVFVEYEPQSRDRTLVRAQRPAPRPPRRAGHHAVRLGGFCAGRLFGVALPARSGHGVALGRGHSLGAGLAGP
jgi:ornithine cyclodeaminase